MRNIIKLLELADERISIANIDRVIKSLPTRPEMVEDPGWQTKAFAGKLIKSIENRNETLTEDQWSDLKFAAAIYLTKNGPRSMTVPAPHWR